MRISDWSSDVCSSDLVFVGTLAWTIWGSGLSYWRWIPRLGLVVVLGFFVALLAPRLAGWRSRGLARGLAALLVVLFVGAFALAFVPHGVVQTARGGAAARAGSSTTPPAMDMPAPQADARDRTDRHAYGRIDTRTSRARGTRVSSL